VTDVNEVVTSGRRFGRTPGGYARYLRDDLVRIKGVAGGSDDDSVEPRAVAGAGLEPATPRLSMGRY